MVLDPFPKEVELEVVDVSCAGRENGQVQVVNKEEFTNYRINEEEYLPNSSFQGLASGAYTLWARDQFGCEVEQSFVIEAPYELLIDLVNELRIDYGIPLMIEYEVLNGSAPYSFQWSTKEQNVLSCYTCENPEINAVKTDIIELEIIDQLGCVGTARSNVFILKDWKVMVPTGFTPNSDGNNDRLLVHGSPNITIKSFEVFNRWGELLFFEGDFPINDKNYGWDGFYRGKPVVSDTYLWKINALLPDGKEQSFFGNSNLIR